MSFTFSVVEAGEGGSGSAVAAPVSDSDDYSLSEDVSDSDDESDANGGANLDEEQDEFNLDINRMLHEQQERKEKERKRELEESRKRMAEEARQEQYRLQREREDAARRAHEQHALEKLLGPQIVRRKKQMIIDSKAPSLQSFPQLEPRTRVEVVSYNEGTEGAWTPATLLRIDSSGSIEGRVQYEVKYDVSDLIAYVDPDHVRPAPPKSGSGIVFDRGEKVEVLKEGRWHPAVVIKRTNNEGMTHIRWDRTHKTDEVYNDNDYSDSLKIRFRKEWTGEFKAGRRGAQGWGWVRWENASNEELRSKQTSRKRKRDLAKNSTHSSQGRAVKRRTDHGGTGSKDRSHKTSQIESKKKKKKKKKTSSAWAKLAKYR